MDPGGEGFKVRGGTDADGEGGRDIFDWETISFDGTASCSQWKATIAFAFLSAMCWLGSAILG